MERSELAFYRKAKRINDEHEKKGIFVDTGFERLQIFVRKGQNAELKIKEYLERLQKSRIRTRQ